MKKAFTLIELLVVIAIIAILAAILFPVFAQAKLAAKKTNALSEVKQIGLGTLVYMNDSDDHTVPNWYSRRSDGAYTSYMDMVYPYLKNTALAINAQSVNTADYSVAAATGKVVAAHYVIPAFNPWTYYNWAGTVMFAGWPVESNEVTTASGGVCSGLSAYAFCVGPGQVDQPADAVSLVPGALITYKLGAGYAGADLMFGSTDTVAFPCDPTTVAGKSTFIFNTGANYGFCDGHAKYFAAKKLNGDNSSTYNYGGTNYPASPFMKVKS